MKLDNNLRLFFLCTFICLQSYIFVHSPACLAIDDREREDTALVRTGILLGIGSILPQTGSPISYFLKKSINSNYSKMKTILLVGVLQIVLLHI